MDDSLVKKAVCINVADSAQRAACLAQMLTDRAEALQLCTDQRDTRLDTCKLLGQDRYDPDLNPALFDDPRNPTQPNPYFPLTVGYRWDYRAGSETDDVEVVNETKLIAGIQCIVVRDLVSRDGFIVEATDDWYAPAKNGASWYFGEEAKDFEVFDGDDPKRPELVSIDGSFKAGRNGDKPGIIFLASPDVGDVYVEEASLGNAEDVTVVLSTTYSLEAAHPSSTNSSRRTSPHSSVRAATVSSPKTFRSSSRASSLASTTLRASAWSWKWSPTRPRRSGWWAATSIRGARCWHPEVRFDSGRRRP
jgi:hypothetical protein